MAMRSVGAVQLVGRSDNDKAAAQRVSALLPYCMEFILLQ